MSMFYFSVVRPGCLCKCLIDQVFLYLIDLMFLYLIDQVFLYSIYTGVSVFN